MTSVGRGGILKHMGIAAGYCLAVVMGAAPSVAQQDSARLTGRVASSRDGRPVPGVMVSVRAVQLFQVTDSSGTFAIAGLPAGAHTLRITYGDRVSEDHPVTLRTGRTLDLYILLDVDAVVLTPIVVEARRAEASLNLVGFYARKRRGFGRFFTRDDIEHRRPRSMSVLLSGTGIRLACVRGNCVATQLVAGRRCTVPVYLDGVWAPQYQIDWVPPQDVAGFEVYRQASDTPVEFGRSGGGCGALVVWTRRGGRERQ